LEVQEYRTAISLEGEIQKYKAAVGLVEEVQDCSRTGRRSTGLQ
jgi:hypothetical protein